MCRSKEKAERVFEEWLHDEDFHLMIQLVEIGIEYPGNIDYFVHAASSSQSNVAEQYPVDILKANMVGPKMNVTIKELAELLVKTVFPDRKLQVIVKKSTRGKNVQRLMISIEKLGKLNWRPEVDLNEGFRRLVYSEELDRK